MDNSKSRSSQDLVMRRCIALLTRLITGPTTTRDLYEIVKSFSDRNEDVSESAITKRFENDRERLKEWFGCAWEFDRKSATYTLTGIEYPLIDLSGDALDGLAFLQATFSSPNVPMNRQIQALFNILSLTLPEQHRNDLARKRGAIELDLNPRDKDPINDDVMQAVQRAYGHHQLLEFDYGSPSRTDGVLVHHRVEPYRYFFADGHYYLEAHCLETYSSTNGMVRQVDFRRYRIGRMSNAQVLPTRFLPDQRKIWPDELIYELSPEIARFGVTEHFPDSIVAPHEDGSATVHALSNRLFLDLRELLHYGAGCRVIGGEKAVREMKVLVNQMYHNYQQE